MTFTQYILYVAHEIDRRLPFFNSSTLIDCAEAFSLSTAPLDQELAETSCISHHSTGSKPMIIIVIMTSDFMKTSKGIDLRIWPLASFPTQSLFQWNESYEIDVFVLPLKLNICLKLFCW